jgi:hypothetical protein
MPFPLIPLAVGAGLGGANALFGGGGLFGKKPQMRQLSQYSPGAQQGMDWLVQQGRQNADWSPIEQRARQQFQQNTIPSIAERFTSLGEGAQESSAFGGELGGAASDLESQLASLRSQYGLQQMQTGLKPQFDYYQEQGKPGFLQGAFSGAAEGMGGLGGMSEGLSSMFGGQNKQQGKYGEITSRDKDLLMRLINFLHKRGGVAQGGL